MYISIVSRSYFFFFNQQTAYEMRISDWSSDVCSSDLQHRRNLAELPLRHRHRDDDRDHEGDRALDRRGRRGERAFTARREFVGEEEDEQRPEIDQDRKSVVEGKSVSVRVDIGGRRIIKKQRRKEYTNIT